MRKRRSLMCVIVIGALMEVWGIKVMVAVRENSTIIRFEKPQRAQRTRREAATLCVHIVIPYIVLSHESANKVK